MFHDNLVDCQTFWAIFILLAPVLACMLCCVRCQINGIPVQSRDQVLRLLGSAAGASCISLTLARRDVTPQVGVVEKQSFAPSGDDAL
jgi:hypothetical protein